MCLLGFDAHNQLHWAMFSRLKRTVHHRTHEMMLTWMRLDSTRECIYTVGSSPLPTLVPARLLHRPGNSDGCWGCLTHSKDVEHEQLTGFDSKNALVHTVVRANMMSCSFQCRGVGSGLLLVSYDNMNAKCMEHGAGVVLLDCMDLTPRSGHQIQQTLPKHHRNGACETAKSLSAFSVGISVGKAPSNVVLHSLKWTLDHVSAMHSALLAVI